MEEANVLDVKRKHLWHALKFTVNLMISRYPNVIENNFPFLWNLFLAQHECAALRVVPREVIVGLLNRHRSHILRESSHIILIPQEKLCNIGLPEGGWACIIVGNLLEAVRIRLVQVFPLEDWHGSALISDVYLHNLKLCSADAITCAIYNSPVSPLNGRIMENFVPFTATKVEVSPVIQDPKALTEEDIEDMETMFSVYFSSPKYFVKGDVFCINVKDMIYYVPLEGSVPWFNYWYFKVTDICGPKYICKDSIVCGYLIDAKKTTIKCSSSVSCLVPRVVDVGRNKMKKLTVQNFESYIVSKCPTGLQFAYQELLQLCKPFLDFHELKIQTNAKPCFLLFGPDGVGKREIVECVGEALGLQVYDVDCRTLHNFSSYRVVEENLLQIQKQAERYNQGILLLRKIEFLGLDKTMNLDARVIRAFMKCIEKICSNVERLMYVVGTSDTNNSAPTDISRTVSQLFPSVIHVPAPTETQREEILSWLINREEILTEVSLKDLAHDTPGFTLVDLKRLLSIALKNQFSRVINDDSADRRVLENEDIKLALAQMNAEFVDSIGSPKVPAVSWEDVGGLHKLKKEIFKTINLPLQHPELTSGQLRRSGILLYGPPGTGKTLVAKAVATECKLNFLSVKGPELLDPYVGNSEANVREVFARARSSLPCIIFFDELDSLAPIRGKAGDSGGVMDRIVSQLLTEMDGLEKSPTLFIIGATNRPDLLDPSLLRPGRLDKLLYVGAYEDRNSQLSVLKALTRKFHFKSDIDLSNIVAHFPEYVTGADVYSLCSDAWMSAVESCVRQFEDENIPLPDKVEVGKEDFMKAIASFNPSVSKETLRHFTQVYKHMSS